MKAFRSELLTATFVNIITDLRFGEFGSIAERAAMISDTFTIASLFATYFLAVNFLVTKRVYTRAPIRPF